MCPFIYNYFYFILLLLCHENYISRVTIFYVRERHVRGIFCFLHPLRKACSARCILKSHVSSDFLLFVISFFESRDLSFQFQRTFDEMHFAHCVEKKKKSFENLCRVDKPRQRDLREYGLSNIVN
ncbi:hypothetical protein PUN28_008587 [Cardiocondyla obscurior]|uniref:Secreted protein n=1 Tax=Cardiocondyla obscurior TaxID=286306 RepID=A0AAW2FZX6_9HYME